jgi:hypothetical protein
MVSLHVEPRAPVKESGAVPVVHGRQAVVPLLACRVLHSTARAA